MLASEAVLFRDAISSVISKKGQNHFKETIKRLRGD